MMESESIEIACVNEHESRPRSKLAAILSNINIEPFLFLAIFSNCLVAITSVKLLMSRVCLIEKHYSEDVCGNLTADVNIIKQLDVQKSANNWITIQNVLLTLPGIVIVVFIGPWSDRYGRKYPLLIPLVGSIFCTCGMIVVSTMRSLPPYMLVLTNVPSAFCGSFIFIMIAMTYVADTTPLSMRTSKYALVDGSMILGVMAGRIFGGYIQKKYGFVAAYCCTLICQVVGVVYGIIFIKESRGLDNKDNWRYRIKYFFELESVQESFRCYFKPYPRGRRLALILLTCCLTSYSINTGTQNVMFQYTQLALQWSEWKYSLYQSINGLISVISSVVCIITLRNIFSISDHVLGIISALSAVSSSIVCGIAKSISVFFIGTALGVLILICAPITRSCITKLVEPDEVAKVFAIVAIAESTTPVICSLVYPQIYNATIAVFPSCFIFVAGFVSIIPLAVFLGFRNMELNDKLWNEATSEPEQSAPIVESEPCTT